MSWWHAYGRTMPDDDPEFPGCWVQMTVGPSPAEPDGLTETGHAVKAALRLPDGPEIPYLTSWNREPTDEEKAALEPAECERCGNLADHDTATCCSSHGKVLCHACYRRTHFVEVCDCGRPECERPARTVELPAEDVASA